LSSIIVAVSPGSGAPNSRNLVWHDRPPFPRNVPIFDPTGSEAQPHDSIDVSTIVGLRDRALIGVMVYAFARISAVVAMEVANYFPNGKRWWVQLQEKRRQASRDAGAPEARAVPR
jgi:hypothetical protein